MAIFYGNSWNKRISSTYVVKLSLSGIPPTTQTINLLHTCNLFDVQSVIIVRLHRYVREIGFLIFPEHSHYEIGFETQQTVNRISLTYVRKVKIAVHIIRVHVCLIHLRLKVQDIRDVLNPLFEGISVFLGKPQISSAASSTVSQKSCSLQLMA